jgi:hypothetical protein
LLEAPEAKLRSIMEHPKTPVHVQMQAARALLDRKYEETKYPTTIAEIDALTPGQRRQLLRTLMDRRKAQGKPIFP